MVVVSVRVDGLHDFQKSLRHINAHVNKRCQQALNRTLQRSRTKMTNVISEKLNLRKKIIREQISIQKANKNIGLIGKLTVKHKPVPLIEYNAKQNRKGVSFKVFKDRPRQLVRHAFISFGKRSIQSVFRREYGVSRLKIKPLYGTTVKDQAINILNTTAVFARNALNKELQRCISW